MWHRRDSLCSCKPDVTRVLLKKIHFLFLWSFLKNICIKYIILYVLPSLTSKTLFTHVLHVVDLFGNKLQITHTLSWIKDQTVLSEIFVLPPQIQSKHLTQPFVPVFAAGATSTKPKSTQKYLKKKKKEIQQNKLEKD